MNLADITAAPRGRPCPPLCPVSHRMNLADQVTFDDAAFAYAALSGVSFAEAVARMQAAIHGLVETTAALERMCSFRPVSHGQVERFSRMLRRALAGHRDRPPRRAARRAHARRLAKRR